MQLLRKNSQINNTITSRNNYTNYSVSPKVLHGFNPNILSKYREQYAYYVYVHTYVKLPSFIHHTLAR